MSATVSYDTLAKLLIGATAGVVLTWAVLHRSDGSTPVWRAGGNQITGAATMAAKSDFRCVSSVTFILARDTNPRLTLRLPETARSEHWD